MPAAFPAKVLFMSERGAQALAVSLFFCRVTRICDDKVDVTSVKHVYCVFTNRIVALTAGSKSLKKLKPILGNR